jgi:protocatechuate 3,4-dioxygenase beta subunit
MNRNVLTGARRYPLVEDGVHPAASNPAYVSNRLRHPLARPIAIPQTISELTGPSNPYGALGASEDDLTRQHAGQPIGERIILEGRVLDEDGRPIPETLVEIWQANAAGRYAHPADNHPAPLDPNFTGHGRAITDAGGRYRFTTIMPGRYPWPNHYNAWRPSHIHFSLFGQNFLSRLTTQMYFPGDPLQALDPVLNSIADPRGRDRLVCAFDIGLTRPDWAIGFRWDIVLRGRAATPFEDQMTAAHRGTQGTDDA